MGGFGNGLGPVFLAEISTPKIRGGLCVCHQLIVDFGCVVASIVGLPQSLSTADRWPYLFLVNAVPIAIAVICLPLIPESPNYILTVCR